MTNPKYDVVRNFKRNFEELLAPIDGHSWSQYWEMMSEDKTWVDSTFIQGAAWLLNHDIIIVTTSSTMNNPYIRVHGNRLSGDLNSKGHPLILGCKSNSHYQSLLPFDKWIFNPPASKTGKIENTQAKLCLLPKEKQYEKKSGDNKKGSVSNGPINEQSQRDLNERDLTFPLGADSKKLRQIMLRQKQNGELIVG